MDASDDEGERDPEIDEVLEAALIALESFLASCPQDMRMYTNETITAATRFLKYDPNLAQDEGFHDLRWVREQAGLYATDPLLLCRTLLASVASKNSQSPLDLPAIARLTPTYHRQEAKTFRPSTDI